MATPTLRVMTFNVLKGGGSPERFARILAAIEAEAPDVLALQECVGWDTSERPGLVADALGVPRDHVVVGEARPRGSGTRYHVALASRRPLADVEVLADPAFLGHCIVRARIERAGGRPLHVIATHLDAHHENLRYVEARYLRAQLDAERFAAEDHVLLGDLNSLSRHDPYPAALSERVASARIDKFGNPVRWDVMDELEAFGWIDVLVAQRSGGDTEGAVDGLAPWVTAPRDRGGVRIDYRTDYVLASPTLAARATAARVLQGTVEGALRPEEAGGVSDHWPVVADFVL